MARSISDSSNSLNNRTILLIVVLFLSAPVVSGLYDDLGFLGVKVRPQRSSFRGSLLRTMFNQDRHKTASYEPKVRGLNLF